jgi:fructose-1-phosphate kinase PfkB-like protein
MINDKVFRMDNLEFIQHYNQHGWVVISGVLSDQMVKNTTQQWIEMKSKYAIEMGLELSEYELEVSQWRDLWLNEGAFKFNF